MSTSDMEYAIFSWPASLWQTRAWLKLLKEKKAWFHFIEEIAQRYKSAEKITLVMDNLNTHTSGSLYETFPPNEAKKLWDLTREYMNKNS